MARMPKTARKTYDLGDTQMQTWFERDRAHVDLQDRETGRTLIEFWDEDVEQLLEDGFLNRRDLHGSLYKYAVHLGVIKPPKTAGRSHATKRTGTALSTTKKKSMTQLDREIAEALGTRPINRRKRVRHFSHWTDKAGRTHYAVTYEDRSGHAITRGEMARFYQRAGHPIPP